MQIKMPQRDGNHLGRGNQMKGFDFMENNNTNKEIWKDISGYEGLYQVSNFGRVKSLNRVVKHAKGGSYKSEGTHVIQEKKMSLKPNKVHGYRQVKLCKNSKISCFRVNRLVAEAFLPNPNNYPVVNHKDENRANDHVENLEWCTHSYNINYSVDKNRKERGYRLVKRTNLATHEVKIYRSIIEAEKEGFSKGNISRVANGNRKSHKGYYWEYLPIEE